MEENEIRKVDLFDRYLELVKGDIAKIFRNRSCWLDIPCIACESNDYEVEFEKEGFQYRRCLQCETLYVSPRPTIDEIRAFYREGKSNIFWIKEFFPPVMETRREKIFRPRAKFVVENFPLKTGCSVADVGAGFGIFLDEIKRIRPDLETVAIEPSLEMAKICRKNGHRVFECFLEDLEGENLFDFVVSFELLEHVYNPQEFVSKIYQILKPGGWLFITTLNSLGFDILILGKHSKATSPPHHLNFLNPNSLRMLMEKCGFIDVKVLTPGKLDWSIVENAYLRGEVQLDKWWRSVIKHGNQKAKESLQAWIANHNFSSHMWGIGKKL